MNDIVNGLWIGNDLGVLELLTIHSFIDNGYTFKLWTYQPEKITVPKNVLIEDASIIIPSEKVFSYGNKNKFGHGKGSYAGFSDIFRYKLLYMFGGIWTDMDVTCIKKLKIHDDYFFRYHHKTGAVGNFMKSPKDSPLMLWCYTRAIEEVNEKNTDWMLPINILNDGIKHFKLEQYIQKISNDDSFPEITRLLSSEITIPEDWFIIHWMNEEFRRLNISKNVALNNSVYDSLLKKYNLKTSNISKKELILYRIKISRINYLWQNIKSRLDWYLS